MNNLLMLQALKPVADCEPVAFTCPRAALDFLRAHVDRIGVVVTDYDMPGLTVSRSSRPPGRSRASRMCRSSW